MKIKNLLVILLVCSWISSACNSASIPPIATATMPPSTNTPVPTNTALPTATPIPDEITDDKGIAMRFVPAGKFIMGSSAEGAYAECQKLFLIGGTCVKDWYANQEPVHTVYLDAYYIDKYEVSNAAYRSCVDAGECSPPFDTASHTQPNYYGNSAYDDYPLINVFKEMADVFCSWRDARLPTEAEWEKAARGEDGNVYPWGNTFDGNMTNFCDINCTSDWANKEYNDGFEDTAPVDAFPDGVSPYGVYNMAGNVWEYVSDHYSKTYYQESPSSNPKGPSSGDSELVKGGTYYYDGSNVMSSNRYEVDWSLPQTLYGTGFRCARSH